MTTPYPPSSDIQDAILASVKNSLTLSAELSLAPLVTFWNDVIATKDSITGAIGRLVQDRIRDAPELLRPIQDLSVLDRHRDLVDALMSAVFPPVFWQQEHGAALTPLRLQAFYATPAFERDLLDGERTLRARISADADTVSMVRMLFAYRIILRRLYDIELDVDYPLTFTTTDPATGLDRHFKMHFDQRFVDVEPVGETPALTPAARQRLAAQLTDLDVLREILPPSAFRFLGFTVLTAVEVTDQEVLSSIKRDLIDKESIMSETRFEALEAKLRTLFRRPSLHLALAAIEGDRVLMLNSGARRAHACIFADSTHHRLSDFSGSVYERASLMGRPLIVEDLETYPDRTTVEDAKLRMGYRNLIVAPLHYQDNVRYEIIKKRIDKAVIRNTQERLTQPGKIAIVYSHASEAVEYRHYVEYLQKLGHITPGVEDLELAELQGAEGLRALRVTVDLTHPEHETPLAAEVAAGAPPSASR